MKLPNWSAYIIILLITSCNPPQGNNNEDGNQEVKHSKTELEKEEPDSEPIIWDSTTMVGEAMIWRREAVDGSEDWTSVHAFNVDGFRNEVVEGAMVQIFPLADGLPIIELKIINATRREDMGKPSYHIELEEITDKSYWTFKGPPERRAEFPTDLLVLYPPIKQASLMSNKTLLQEDLPENIKSDIIKSALDFDGDGKADAIVCYFCCRDRSPIDNCDYHCNETYVKINNNWVMTNSSQPM